MGDIVKTQTVQEISIETGYSKGTTYSVEAANTTFDVYSGTVTCGQKLSGGQYYVHQIGTEWDLSSVPKYAKLTNAVFKGYIYYDGTRSQTVYPYIYPIDWSTAWSSSDKRTAADLVAVTPIGTKSITASTPSGYHEWTLTPAARYVLQGKFGTSTIDRWILADYRNELVLAPGSSLDAYRMTAFSLILTYTIPDPNAIMLGSNF